MSAEAATSTWTTRPLGELAMIQRNAVLPADIADGTLYVGLEHVASSGAFEGVVPVRNGVLASNKFAFDSEHILYGKLRPYLSKIARPDFRGICSTDILPILPGESVDRNYLYHFLRQPSMVQLAASRCTGANLPRISPKEVEAFRVPIPYANERARSIEEQRRLAAMLDKADAIRRKRLSVVALHADLPRSVFLELFGDPVLNPCGWPLRPLGELVVNRDGERVPLRKADRAARPGPYPYYGASGIIDHIDDYLFEGEHLLVAEDGANLLARTTPIAFLASGRYWVNNHAHVLAQSDEATLRFLCTHLELRDISSLVSGSAQPKITQASLNSLLVACPPIDKQHRFDELLHIYAGTHEKMSRAIADGDNLYHALCQRAFKGEL